ATPELWCPQRIEASPVRVAADIRQEPAHVLPAAPAEGLHPALCPALAFPAAREHRLPTAPDQPLPRWQRREPPSPERYPPGDIGDPVTAAAQHPEQYIGR